MQEVEANKLRRRPIRGHLNKMVDEGWKYFWSKRGYDYPPPVSHMVLGEFNVRKSTTKAKKNHE